MMNHGLSTQNFNNSKITTKPAIDLPHIEVVSLSTDPPTH